MECLGQHQEETSTMMPWEVLEHPQREALAEEEAEDSEGILEAEEEADSEGEVVAIMEEEVMTTIGTEMYVLINWLF